VWQDLVAGSGGRRCASGSDDTGVGVVYIAWASHSDTDPFHGWLIGYNVRTSQQARRSMPRRTGARAPSGRGGGDPAADSGGHIYLSGMTCRADMSDFRSPTPPGPGSTVPNLLVGCGFSPVRGLARTMLWSRQRCTPGCCWCSSFVDAQRSRLATLQNRARTISARNPLGPTDTVRLRELRKEIRQVEDGLKALDRRDALTR